MTTLFQSCTVSKPASTDIRLVNFGDEVRTHKKPSSVRNAFGSCEMLRHAMWKFDTRKHSAAIRLRFPILISAHRTIYRIFFSTRAFWLEGLLPNNLSYFCKFSSLKQNLPLRDNWTSPRVHIQCTQSNDMFSRFQTPTC